ncbi:MAG: cupin domain-containing protein [Verrucomicrobiota bacterium]
MTTLSVSNLLVSSSGIAGEETIATLIERPAFTLEHIVSKGAASPEGFWYDQERSEWVLLLRGEAALRFESGETLRLNAGDHLVIPARYRHRVESCSPDALWLALHYDDEPRDGR